MKTSSKFSNSAYLYALLAAVLWGTTAAVGKLSLMHFNSMQLLFYAALIASVALFFIASYQKKLHLLRSYQIKDYVRFAYMGFLGVFLYYAFLYAGLQYAPAQEAFIVNYTWPIWVVVFGSLLLGDKLTFRKIAALMLGFIGVYIIISQGNLGAVSFQNIKGDGFALLGAVVYGLFSALSKKHDDDKVISTLMYYIFAFIYTAIFIFLFSSLPTVTMETIAGLVWLGVFTSGVAFIFWLSALKHGDTAKMSNLILITPFLSLVFSYFLVGEKIALSSFIGCAIIVSGIVLQKDNA